MSRRISVVCCSLVLLELKEQLCCWFPVSFPSLFADSFCGLLIIHHLSSGLRSFYLDYHRHLARNSFY